MWLFRGAQSAIFYYAACTPCTEQLQRRKRKRDALRTAREVGRDALVADQPVFYQPSPFSTNTYWSEEIALGPGPPTRRGRNNAASRTSSQRNLASLDKPAVTERAVLTGVLEDSSVPEDKKDLDRVDRRWNSVRYQRDDEALWGYDGKWSSTSLRATTRGSSKYSIDPPPEVNDLYPPIAGAIQNKEEIQWMLQPPPSAKVMEGKVRADSSSRLSSSGSPLLRGVKPSSSTASRYDRGGQSPLVRPSPAQRAESSSYSPIKSRKSSTAAAMPRLIPIDSSISLSNTAQSPGSSLPLPSTTAPASSSSSPPPRGIRSQSYDHHGQQANLSSSVESNSNSPLELKPYVSLPSLQSPNARQHHRYETEYRPASKETIDSGKAFHPTTPSTPWLRAANHPNISKLPSTSTLHINDIDNSSADHAIDEEEFDRLDRIRTYRWSMDF
ncbi:uncharacterized protein GIQ15_05557 [Arthroderma uncinatum]|uniref:uncharacterized protein n=1 Tax=Arthroderma uncinatum TaxID=74035 RepID=UPI00144A6691|nr:uncharacterized protein GIQ15_05557 [Arthroderma uncinatum]KAF3480210.1 hypothetical protein GIQ15_05557 [Arthroderma uncinatum]